MAKELSVRIIENAFSLQPKINAELVRIINSKRAALARRIQQRLIKLSTKVFKESPEYQSFVDPGTIDSLKAHFGFSTGFATKVQDTLLDIILNSIQVVLPPLTSSATGIKSQWEVRMIPNSHEDLLGSEVASYTSQPSGEEINWLDWLLFAGDSIIISTHEIEFGDFRSTSRGSRSGKAVMALEEGAGWRVPPQFSGTANNNWITRTFRDNAKFRDFFEIEVALAFQEIL